MLVLYYTVFFKSNECHAAVVVCLQMVTNKVLRLLQGTLYVLWPPFGEETVSPFLK